MDIHKSLPFLVNAVEQGHKSDNPSMSVSVLDLCLPLSVVGLEDNDPMWVATGQPPWDCVIVPQSPGSVCSTAPWGVTNSESLVSSGRHGMATP